MLIDAGQKKNIIAFQPAISRDDVGEALPLEHRTGALCGAQACRPVFQFPRRENTKVWNLLSVGRDSVEPTEIRLAPRRGRPTSMARVGALFLPRSKMQKQK